MRTPGRRAVTVAAYLVAWLLLACASSAGFFLASRTKTSVAGHDAVVRPTLDGWATVHTGPYLPDLRARTGGRVGVDIVLGKTEVTSVEELAQRYAFIASQPDAQVERVRQVVRDQAEQAALRGAVAAVVPLLLWAAIGPVRRRELARGLERPGLLAFVVVLSVVLGVMVWRPWAERQRLLAEGDWEPLVEYLPTVDVPEEVPSLQVSRDVTSLAAKRLIASAIDTYRQSRDFYDALVERAERLDLPEPAEGHTVAVLVSDRHDNVGMDRVARAIGDRAGATAVLNAGDDTSTGAPWEAFSLDSLHASFGDVDRWSVSGNHDHGGFVRDYLADRGWVVAAEEVVDGPGGGLLLAYDDPRSSGLGNWRDVDGETVSEVAERAAEVACESDERVNTLLVHDADMGSEALARGCVDLVLAGHVHTRVGPTRVDGPDGSVGWRFETGTTGGAAYAVAVGSKLRRPAMVTLVTYDESGRPVSLQPVTVQTNGAIDVAEPVPLEAGE